MEHAWGLFFCWGLFWAPLMQAHTVIIQEIGSGTPSGFSQELVVGKLHGAYDFIWSRSGGVQELSYVNSSQMPLINTQGDVAGIYWKRSNHWFGENKWTKCLYVRKPDGSFSDLGLPEGWEKRAVEEWKIGYVSEKESLFKELSFWDKKEISILAFNDKGEMLVGNSTKAADMHRYALWNGQGFMELDLPLDRIYSMNNQGCLLGRKWIETSEGLVPFLVLYEWRAAAVVGVVLVDTHLIHRELTEEGQVLLVQKEEDEEEVKGFLWDPEEGLVDLNGFVPFKINRQGQMVGKGERGSVYALWDRGEVINLEMEMGMKGSKTTGNHITRIVDFNDEGVILGEGIFEGKQSCFLLHVLRDNTKYKSGY